ncbi:hypothetical protein ACHHYP_08123 [Achlya hypogyna]|uniref:PHD-type domain-containing protein n=1 Tax=Achlya hypogyna TaxID=1202772 RepID=A0A1V9YPU8_ACHHY|nr:hypothetical protein ACHHYP_08123 [Achlya hypogyna]
MEALMDHALFGFSVADPGLKEAIETVRGLLEGAAGEDDFVELVSDALDMVEEIIKTSPSSHDEYGHLLPSVENLRDEVDFAVGTAPSTATAKPAPSTFEFNQPIQWSLASDLPPPTHTTCATISPIEAPALQPAVVRCDVCWGEESFVDNRIVICEECEVAVHESCYHIARVPDAAWYCLFCTAQLAAREAEIASCAACHELGGALVPTIGNEWVHMACTLYLPELYFIHDKVDGLDLLQKRRKLKCSICRAATGAAAVQCDVGKCTTAYHVMCALKAGVRFERRGDAYVSLCPAHAEPSESKPREKPPRTKRPEPAPSSSTTPSKPKAAPAAVTTPAKPPVTATATPIKPPPVQTPTKPPSMTPSKTPRTSAMKAPRVEYFQTKLPMGKPKKQQQTTGLFESTAFAPLEAPTGDYLMCLVPALPLGLEFEATALVVEQKYVVESATEPNTHDVFTTAFAKGYLHAGDELCAINAMPMANVSPAHMKDVILPQCSFPLQCWFKKRVPLAPPVADAVAADVPPAETNADEWPWCYLRSDGKLAMPQIWRVFAELFHGTAIDASALLASLKSPEALYVTPPIGYLDIPDVILDTRKAAFAALNQFTAPLPPLEVGTMVKVAKRTWPGINKLGGTGRIKARRPVGDGFTYDVAYVLGGRENQVERQWVTPVTMDDPDGTLATAAGAKAEDVEAWTLTATVTAAGPPSATPEASFSVAFAVSNNDDDIIETTTPTTQVIPPGAALRLESVVDVLEATVADEIGPQLHALQEQLRAVDAASKATFDQLSAQLAADKQRAYFSEMEALTNERYEDMYRRMCELHEKHYGPVNPVATKPSKDVARTATGTCDTAVAEDTDDDDDADLPLFITGKQEESAATCVLCGLPGGDLAATSCGQVAHIMCLLYTPETYFDSHLGYGVQDVPAERQSLVCEICRGKQGVNKLQCAHKKCTRSYHVQCAYVRGQLTTLSGFIGWCPKHLKKADPLVQASVDWPPHIKKQMQKDGLLPPDDPKLLPPLPTVDQVPPHKRATPNKKKPVRKRKSEGLTPAEAAPPVEEPAADEPVAKEDIKDEVKNEVKKEVELNVGDTVHVQERTWAGINKAGGVGRIKRKHEVAPGVWTYDVEYVLGGGEKGVEAFYVSPADLSADSGSKKRRRSNAVYDYE